MRHAGAIAGPRRVTPGRVRRHRAGERLRCLVLASGGTEWAAVDLESGALLRARPGTAYACAAPLEVVEIVIAADDEPPDPGRPEAVTLEGPPEPVGRLRARHARRLLASLVARDNVRPLLGGVGPSLPYSDLDGSGPSMVLLEPTRGPEIVAVEGAVWCSFGLGGGEDRLPLVEARAAAVAAAIPGTVLTRSGAASMLGFDPRYLLVGLVAPCRGHARKAVIGMLPRP